MTNWTWVFLLVAVVFVCVAVAVPGLFRFVAGVLCAAALIAAGIWALCAWSTGLNYRDPNHNAPD